MCNLQLHHVIPVIRRCEQTINTFNYLMKEQKTQEHQETTKTNNRKKFEIILI